MTLISINPQEEVNHSFSQLFQLHGFETEVKPLDCDLCVEEFSIGIERKSLQDFKASMIDKRIFSQAFYLALGYQWPFVIVDEDPVDWQGFDPEVYWGLEASLLADYHVLLKVTYGNLPYWLKAFVRHLRQGATTPINPFRAPKLAHPDPADRITAICEQLPGIGPVKANRVKGMKLIPAIQSLKPNVRKEFQEWIE